MSEIKNDDLNKVTGGLGVSEFTSLQLKVKYAIGELRRIIRDNIDNNSKKYNLSALKTALNTLELVDNDVSNASSIGDFRFCDRYWGTFKANIRGARMEELFNNPYFIQIEEIIVVE